MRSRVKKALEKIEELKKQQGFMVTDIHVHPLDVMGVIFPSEYDSRRPDDLTGTDYTKMGILEFFKYGVIVSIFSPIYYKILENEVFKSIQAMYKRVGRARLLSEMGERLIDQVVLIPISPWVTLDKIIEICGQNQRFYFLCSPDLHGGNITEIVADLRRWKDLGAIGIKLHPNLQGFMPQPGQNDLEVADKLRAVYRFAEEENLMILFHGGVSFYTKNVDSRYKKIKRSKTNARLENFINHDGTSEIFGQYNMPIIIAHLGHFGVLKPNYSLMQKIVKRYQDVYFDTAGCSPGRIKKATEAISSKRICFGTDSIYNRMVYGLYYLYTATRNLKSEDPDSALKNILSSNFEEIKKKVIRK